MHKYPDVIEEFKTVQMLIDGYSISRFGDGEMNHVNGHKNVSQDFVPGLQKELKEILHNGNTGKHLVGIPPLKDDSINKKEFWLKNNRVEKYASMLNPKASYASSFISRPDNQPKLNCQEYYDLVRKIWQGKDILLISPSPPDSNIRSFKPDMMNEVNSIEMIDAPLRSAYVEIDRIEKDIGDTKRIVMLCLGPTATVLAWRLYKKGIHALDLGFLGTFFDNFHKYKKDIFTEKDWTRHGAFYLNADK